MEPVFKTVKMHAVQTHARVYAQHLEGRHRRTRQFTINLSDCDLQSACSLPPKCIL